MEHLGDLIPSNPVEIASAAIGFIIGNAWWYVRQSLWQKRVMKSHGKMTEENRKEEEKTRALIRELLDNTPEG